MKVGRLAVKIWIVKEREICNFEDEVARNICMFE